MVVFIGCGALKRNAPCKACDMYVGSFFTKCLQYSKTFPNSKTYILSANYGLLDLDTVISPYNLTLNNFTSLQIKEWSSKVRGQFVEHNILPTETAVFICGKNYYSSLRDYFTDVQIPLSGLSGMGYQMQYMTECINRTKPISVHKNLF